MQSTEEKKLKQLKILDLDNCLCLLLSSYDRETCTEPNKLISFHFIILNEKQHKHLRQTDRQAGRKWYIVRCYQGSTSETIRKMSNCTAIKTLLRETPEHQTHEFNCVLVFLCLETLAEAEWGNDSALGHKVTGTRSTKCYLYFSCYCLCSESTQLSTMSHLQPEIIIVVSLTTQFYLEVSYLECE